MNYRKKPHNVTEDYNTEIPLWELERQTEGLDDLQGERLDGKENEKSKPRKASDIVKSSKGKAKA